MQTTRRTFIAAATLGSIAPWLASCATAPRRRPLRAQGEPLRLACIGTANRAWDNINEVRHERIVALCDVDGTYLARAAAEFPQARTFKDFRELLAMEAELNLDGVVVSTPDHTHALATALALQAGLPVYCEKPLTRTVRELAVLRRLWQRHPVATQMGTQIHAGENYRRVVEAIRAGAIGRVTAVDCWQQKSWGDGRLTPGAVAPPTLDWELWQGPAPRRPYIEGVHPANWRRYWAYGSGTLGDMGCHIIDLPFWALDLQQRMRRPIEVFAEGPPVDAVGAPAWLEASWAFEPDAPGADPFVLRWFDGGRMSPFVQEIGAKDRVDYHGRFSVCFQGTEGALFANYGEMLLWPGARAQAWTPPAPSIAPSIGHHREWLEAIRSGQPYAPLCGLPYATLLTELVLLGTVAYRANAPMRYDPVRMRVIGNDAADALLGDHAVDGWRLPRHVEPWGPMP
ncbi:MAG: Gfo/Idh/MocA family protein [Phycisphaerales bacterium]